MFLEGKLAWRFRGDMAVLWEFLEGKSALWAFLEDMTVHLTQEGKFVKLILKGKFVR
jgi:hypothetical protein